jgi:hypothetical protein
MTGRDLMHQGIHVQAAAGQLALVFVYSTIK